MMKMENEIKRNKEMVVNLNHVSTAFIGTYGYLEDIILWMSRRAYWKYCYDGVYECTYCHNRVSVGEDENGMLVYLYCPHCGATIYGKS